MSRTEGSPIASAMMGRMGKPKGQVDEDEDRLEGLYEEYHQAQKPKDKARALRAFVRLASRYENKER